LDFYRTNRLIPSPDIPLELLKEELDFFQMDIEEYSDNKRLSVELMKLEYQYVSLILTFNDLYII